MVQTVYLNENEHAVTMLHGLRQMIQEEDLCDFIIKVNGIEYQTHKNILSAGSPYFRAMFKHGTKECHDGKVEMKDVDHECVKSCVNFLYSGNFDIPDGKIVQLLHVAIMLQLDTVTKAVCEILNTSLSVENFYETRDIARMYDLQTVSKSCTMYYKDNFMEITLQAGFQTENKSDLINILKSKYLKLSAEEKLTVSIRWVGEDAEKREDIADLIKLINFKDVSSQYLSDTLESNPVVSNDLRLHKLITALYIEKTKAIKTSGNQKDSCRNLIVLFDFSADGLRSYDPKTNEVEKLHNEKFKHLRDFTAVSIGSYIYVLCQNSSVHRLNFRDKNSKWERMRDMIVDHGVSPPVVPLSGSLFVIGSHNKPMNAVEKYDPTVNLWSRLNDKPTATRSPTLVSLNDSIFCIGGWDGTKVVNSFCRFTPSSSDWVDLEPMRNVQYACSAVAVEQKIFVMGGWRDRKKLNKVECYDVALAQWTSPSPMIDTHGWCVAHHIDDWMFVLELGENLDKVEKYDVANDRWCNAEIKGDEQLEIYASVLIQI